MTDLPRCTRSCCDNAADPGTGVCNDCKKILTDAGHRPTGLVPLDLTTGPNKFRGRSSYTGGELGCMGRGQWPAGGCSTDYDGHDDYNDGVQDDV